MEKKVFDFIQNNQLVHSGESLLIGVSGGADSMALLHFMCQYKRDFNCHIGVAHLHHDMRGAIADEDAITVKAFCEHYNIPFYFKKVNVVGLARTEKITVEEAGRKARYEFFNEIMNQEGFHLLATAHHMDDQAETLLMRLVRGTGLKGASGIPVKQGRIIRPLLCVTKDEIEKYCQNNQILTRYDATNDDDSITRNKIRHQIMPVLHMINPSASKHFADFSNKVTECQDFLEISVNHAKNQLFHNHLNFCFIEEFSQLHPYLQKEILRCGIEFAGGTLVDVEQKHLEMILKKIQDHSSVWKLCLNHDVIVRRAYEKLYFEKNKKKKPCFGCYFIPIDHPGIYQFDDFILKVEVLLTNSIKIEEYCKKDCSIFLSYDTIDISVCIRSRREGDCIMLPGTQGHKKVKKLLIDRKIHQEKRDHIPMIAIDNEVLMIPGVARDKRYLKPDQTFDKTIKLTMEFTNESGH